MFVKKNCPVLSCFINFIFNSFAISAWIYFVVIERKNNNNNNKKNSHNSKVNQKNSLRHAQKWLWPVWSQNSKTDCTSRMN